MKEESPEKFLRHCAEHFRNWKGRKLEFVESDFDASQIGKTLRKTVYEYHPDRQKQDRAGIYNENDVKLREEITMILNYFIYRK